MATFLTTPRMNPALRDRVERAVSHRSRAKHHAAKVGLKTPFASSERLRMARVIPLLALLLVVGLGSATYVHGSRLFEDERAALLTTIEERRAGLPAGYEGFVADVDHWIGEGAGEPAPADFIDPELRQPGALDGWLGRPAVYVRATTAELRDPHKLDDAAAASIKDSFLYCLMSPPGSAAEADVLTKVRGVYFGGAKVDEQTANVRRLAEARIGLSVLTATFENTVRAAEEPLALKKLRKDLQAAPVEEARMAAAAELLILVADEAAKAGARAARVSLVDLAGRRPLLQARIHIVAAGSSATATVHRAEIEGCGLALSLRRSVEE